MRRVLAPALLALACGPLALGSCNNTPLSPLGDTIDAVRLDTSDPLGTNAVDILWIVDDSGSMSEEQIELGAKFASFVDALADLDADFRIAVITTDTRDRNDSGQFVSEPGPSRSASPVCGAPVDSLDYCGGQTGPVLNADDYADLGSEEGRQQLIDDFLCLATVGDCGSGFEAGLDAMQMALSGQLLEAQNSGFLRDDAFLAIIFVTDEDDCSSGGALQINSDSDCYIEQNRDALTPVSSYYDFLIDLKRRSADETDESVASRILIAGIIGPDDGLPPQQAGGQPIFSCISAIIPNPSGLANGEVCTDDEQCQTLNCTVPSGGTTGTCALSDATARARAGDRYSELIDMFGETGVEEDICQGDFGAALRQIGQVIASALDNNCLSDVPQTCDDDSDCGDGIACLGPFGTVSGPSFCADFEMAVQIIEPGDSVYESLEGPGPVGDLAECTNGVCTTGEPPATAQFDVNYGSDTCPTGVSFTFTANNRPVPNSRYRAIYPIDVTTSIDTSEGSGSVTE